MTFAYDDVMEKELQAFRLHMNAFTHMKPYKMGKPFDMSDTVTITLSAFQQSADRGPGTIDESIRGILLGEV